MIDSYVRELGDALRGPARHKHDLLREARDGLDDAAEAFRSQGMTVAEAERRAIAEFGRVTQVAGAFQTELTSAAARALTLRVALVWALLAPTADLMWRGASWSGAQPTAAYRLLSDSLERLWTLTGAFAAVVFLWTVLGPRLVRRLHPAPGPAGTAGRAGPAGTAGPARLRHNAVHAGSAALASGPATSLGSAALSEPAALWERAALSEPAASWRMARTTGRMLGVALGLGWFGWVGIYVWSVIQWEQALTWPPMLVGVVVLNLAYIWLFRAVRCCLRAAG